MPRFCALHHRNLVDDDEAEIAASWRRIAEVVQPVDMATLVCSEHSHI